MSGFVIKTEISIGDLLTAVTIIVSIVALIIAWYKDQQLKRKEYADKIRRSAGTIIAKLERWKELSLSFFDEVQPIITDADALIVKEQETTIVRDTLWRNVVALRAMALKRILDEQVEIAYADLYGYDPRIQLLFSGALRRLRIVDREIYNLFMMLTQQDVLVLNHQRKPYRSAQLGNRLRDTNYKLSQEHAKLMDGIISSFRNEIIKLIRATDNEIVKRQIEISPVNKIYPSMKKILENNRALTELAMEHERPFVEAYQRHVQNLCSEEYYKSDFGVTE